jgi:5-aminolevulinate synthase
MNEAFPYRPSPFDFESFIQSKLDAIKSNGSYRQFISIDKCAGSFPDFNFKDGEGNIRQATNWCTNDYLALSTSISNIETSMASSLFAGTGSGGTRNISGNTVHHLALEEKLAQWHRKEKALLFNSAYQANQTALTTLGRMIPGLIFISDEENHASMIEGMRATPSQKHIFKHNDIQDLEDVLKRLDLSAPKLIVFESVYSISGTRAPLMEIVELARKYNCLTYIDEVHAVGLYGHRGAGLSDELNLEDQVDFINGTLSKAIGVYGGYLAASASWIDFIRSFGSGFIFTTSLPPAICATALNSIEHIEMNPDLRSGFFNNLKVLRETLFKAGIQFTGHHTHITNIHIGNATLCKKISDELLNQYGIYVQPINQPTVQEGNECLRITITPRHSLKDIERLVDCLNKVVPPEIILSGRNSALSKVQIELVKEKINQLFPDVRVITRFKESRGDQLQDVPLHTQEGIDFFTEEIFNDLDSGKVDIAVHSLKDMSNDHFFGNHHFAVVDRDEVRDVAIFNENITELIQSGKSLRIGTCSFRREVMALQFLRKALPQLGNEIKIESLPIRGNIDTRLQKLSSGLYDGIILAFAGINRMLHSADYSNHMQSLLRGKKIMVLPLIECTPAPCQGAIVAECLPSNGLATYILDRIMDPSLQSSCTAEKRIAGLYGSGCIQKFGVNSMNIQGKQLVLAKGETADGSGFEHWHGLDFTIDSIQPEHIMTSDMLGFSAVKSPVPLLPIHDTGSFFVAHISAIDSFDLNKYSKSRVWAAGTATWAKLAKKGIWVEGCADSLGLKSIEKLLKTAVLKLDPSMMQILTNQTSVQKWIADGYQATGTYSLHFQSNLIDKYKLSKAKLIFWNCFAHYDSVKDIIPPDLIHACLPGKTSEQLQDLNLDPLIFPTIEAFNLWKKKYILQYIAA